MTTPSRAALLLSLLAACGAPGTPGPGAELASYRAHLAAAEAALRDHRGAPARAWLDGAPEGQRGWEWQALRSRTEESAARWPEHGAAVESLAWSPDGRRLASASADGSVVLRDGATGEALRSFELEGSIPSACAFDPSGERLACAYVDGTLALFGDGPQPLVLHRPDEEREAALNRTPNRLAWSPDGRELAVVRPGRIDLHAATTLEPTGSAMGTRPWPMACAVGYSPDGVQRTSAFWDGLVLVHEVASGAELQRHEPAPERGFHAYHDLLFDPAGQRLGGATFDGSVRLLPVPVGAPQVGRAPSTSQALTAAFSPDGATLAAGHGDGSLRLWQAEGASLELTWLGHPAAITALAYSPDGGRLVSGSADGSLRLWDTGERRGAWPQLAVGSAVWSAPFSPDGARLATASSDGRARVWDLATGRVLHELGPLPKEATSVAFAAGGRELVVATNEPLLRRLALDGSGAVTELHGHSAGVPNLAVDPSGTLLASASYDRTVRLWHLPSGQGRGVLEANAYACAFSPEGARLATNDGPDLLLVGAEDAAPLARLSAPAGSRPIRSLAWSPDGAHLLAGHADGRTHLWQVPEGRLVQAAQAHAGLVYGASFHPDGTRYATASYDGTLRLWSPESAAPLATLWDLPDKAYFTSFSPDGTCLAVSTIDGTVTLVTVPRVEGP